MENKIKRKYRKITWLENMVDLTGLRKRVLLGKMWNILGF